MLVGDTTSAVSGAATRVSSPFLPISASMTEVSPGWMPGGVARTAMIRSWSSCHGGSRSPSQPTSPDAARRSEEHTSELQSQSNLVCRLLLEKKTLVDWAARGAPVQILVSFLVLRAAAATESYTLSLHDALPISSCRSARR